jgi:polar amino acid transport system substrate-binding protein
MFWHLQTQKNATYKKLAISVLSFSLSILTTPPAIGETVLEKIARTGTITAGTSKDALPFAYRNDAGELVGYSVDILELITDQLSQELGQEIELELETLEPKERIPSLVDGDVDIVCDASSFTWERDRKIDFSVSYGSTGTQLLTKIGNDFSDAASLAGKKIGALAKTTNEQAIRLAQPAAEIVIVKDRAEGYKALRDGEIDAFASDGILLESWLQTRADAENYQIVGYYSTEGIACMVAENNSQLLNVVNYSLVEFMQGVVDGQAENVAIFDRWFGAKGVLPLTEDLRTLMIDNMLLLIDFKERIPEP